MINKETAAAFDDNISDGFIRPSLAWSATNPTHVNGTLGSSMTSNFWIGKPEDVKNFANRLAKFYKDFCSDEDNFGEELDEYESVSVAYWEGDGIAMCAELSTSEQLYGVLPRNFFEEAEKTLKHVLYDGNDNHPGLIFLEQDELNLTVEERISLAKFMKKTESEWLFEDEYREDCFGDFSEEEFLKFSNAFVQ